jgi:hypothetical protein
MLITVILDGIFNEKYDVQVERDTVGVLKKKIAEVLQIPFKGQRLVVSHGTWNFMEDDTKVLLENEDFKCLGSHVCVQAIGSLVEFQIGISTFKKPKVFHAYDL